MISFFLSSLSRFSICNEFLFFLFFSFFSIPCWNLNFRLNQLSTLTVIIPFSRIRSHPLLLRCWFSVLLQTLVNVLLQQQSMAFFFMMLCLCFLSWMIILFIRFSLCVHCAFIFFLGEASMIGLTCVRQSRPIYRQYQWDSLIQTFLSFLSVLLLGFKIYFM